MLGLGAVGRRRLGHGARIYLHALVGAAATAMSAAPAHAATPPPAPGPWGLAFSDDFNGSALNTSRWATQYARTGDLAYSNRANGEIQWYKRSNVTVGGGVLRLTARRERTVSPYSHQTFNYSSGMVTSKPSLNFRYGYIESRVKLPKGAGLWPSFWATRRSGRSARA